MLNNSRYLGVMRLQVLSAGLPSYAIIDIFGVRLCDPRQAGASLLNKSASTHGCGHVIKSGCG
jgi:hypothetical protein